VPLAVLKDSETEPDVMLKLRLDNVEVPVDGVLPRQQSVCHFGDFKLGSREGQEWKKVGKRRQFYTGAAFHLFTS
jgi:hypothetical protein